MSHYEKISQHILQVDLKFNLTTDPTKSIPPNTQQKKHVQLLWIWVFPKLGIPQNGWFMKPLLKWMIWGYPYFWKDPSEFPIVFPNI